MSEEAQKALRDKSKTYIQYVTALRRKGHPASAIRFRQFAAWDGVLTHEIAYLLGYLDALDRIEKEQKEVQG